MSLLLAYCLVLLPVLESSADTFLLASAAGVQLLAADNASITTITSRPATAVDFRYNKNDIYLISDSNIYYSYYGLYWKTHADPILTVRTSHPLSDLVVDWERYRLYFSCQETGEIREAGLIGSTSHPILAHLSNVQDLAIDPYQRLLFFVRGHTVSELSLEDHRETQYDTGEQLRRAVKVAVDHHSRTLYVVGSDEQYSSWYLVSIDYGSRRPQSTLLFNGPELARPFALDVFNFEVVWGSLCDGKYMLFTCKLSLACDIDHLNLIYQSTEKINDVKFYNALVQTPDTNLSCQRLQCSHACVVTGLYSVACDCPLGLILHQNGNVCTERTEESNIWMEKSMELLEALVEALKQSLLNSTPLVVKFIFFCCGLMLALLSCGFCVLVLTPRPKPKRRHESYGLTSRDTSNKSRAS